MLDIDLPTSPDGKLFNVRNYLTTDTLTMNIFGCNTINSEKVL